MNSKQNRLKLHDILCNIVGIEEPDGDKHVYYQPPESKKMKYPAIRYSRANIKNSFADNSVYAQIPAYQLIVIDKKPDSEIIDKVSQLPNCKFTRHYEADNLNHDVFIIYI